MKKLFNHTSEQISEIVNNKPFPYFKQDKFLNDDLFLQLNRDFTELKESGKINWTIIEPPKVTRVNEQKGVNYVIGGGGSNRGSIEPFKQLMDKYESWDYFIKKITSQESFDYFCDIFSNFNVFKNNLSLAIEQNEEWQIGCKISSFTNNYGYIIHPDNINKVLSFLIYLDNKDWDEKTNEFGNGTQIWRVNDSSYHYDKSENSIENQLRNGRHSKKIESLKENEADRVEMIDSIQFKPNRLVGFVRADYSYHSIYPMILSNNVTRNCFQINIWKINGRY